MTSKEIDGFPNYLIFEDGRVFSKKSNKFLKPHIDKLGYCRVDLCNDGKHKLFMNHRLVGLHFIPNPNNKEIIDHIDRNRSNNHISNLRWVTYSENNQNRSQRCDNKTGHKCIHYNKRDNSYRYEKKIQGRKYSKNSKDKIKLLCYKYIMLLRQKAGQL